MLATDNAEIAPVDAFSKRHVDLSPQCAGRINILLNVPWRCGVLQRWSNAFNNKSLAL